MKTRLPSPRYWKAIGALLRGRFRREVAITLLRQFVVVCLSIATAGIVARRLGKEGKGVLSLALLLPGMLALMLSGGVGAANVYLVASRRLGVSSLTENSSAFAIGASLVAFVIMAALFVTGGLGGIVPGVPASLVALSTLGIPLVLLREYLCAILRGLQKITVVNLITTASAGLTLILTSVFVAGLRVGVPGAILASLGAGLGALLLAVAFLQQQGVSFRPRLDLSIMRPTLSFGLKGHVGTVFQFFNYRFDVFVVNYFLGTSSVGIYSVSVALAELLWHLPEAVSFVIFPKAASSTPQTMNAFTPRVFLVTLGVTVVVGLGLLLLAKDLINLVYSSAFLAAYTPMVALLPGVAFLGAAKVLTNDITGRGYPHYNSINAGVALVVTVVLDIVLIPRYGVVGAAVASSIAYTAVFLAAIVFYRRASRKVPSHPSDNAGTSTGPGCVVTAC